jgi:succinate-semialdehyde dehydrogenase/glutarate-semialdehyde dehydrogenase
MTALAGVSGTTITVKSPVSGEPVADVAETGKDEIRAAIARARAALPLIRELSLFERVDCLHRTADVLNGQGNDLARDLAFEHGKTLQQAHEEIAAAAYGLRMTAEYARRLDGSVSAVADPAKRALTRRERLGVVAAITPWNFPLAIPIEYMAPALVMGNAVVWKGAETTPLSNRALARAFAESGWPQDALVSISGGPTTGAALVRSTDLQAVCFTGSPEVGASIARVGGLRKLLLELGGNGPTIVFADADLEIAADRIAAGCFYASGQTCSATERILVEQPAYEPFLEALVTRVSHEQLGDPFSPETTVGPLHLDQVVLKVSAHVADAERLGARVLRGGKVADGFPTRHYFEPTVIAEVRPEMRVFAEETFGPVAPVTPFTDEPEAAELARVGGFGLAGAVFTRDLERAFRVSEWMEVGHVVVNDTSDYWEMHLPFGGSPGTRSGIGRVGGRHALEELSVVKSILVDTGPRTPEARQTVG